MSRNGLWSALTIRGLISGFLVFGLTWFYFDSMESKGALSPDAFEYMAMVEGEDGVSEPFRFRVLVPFLASLLPFSSATSLKLLTSFALVGCYIVVLTLAGWVGVRTSFGVGALVASVMSGAHVYNYGNPFLTDGAGLLAISGAVAAVVAGAFAVFVICIVVGVAVREAILPLVVAWWPRGRRQVIIVAVLAGSVHLVIRSIIGSAGTQNVLQQPDLLDALIAWGPLWIAAPVGLAMLSRSEARHYLWICCIVLAATAVASSLIASDTTRMVGVLFPIVVVGTAVFVQTTANYSRGLAWSFVVLVAAKGIVTIANQLIGPESELLTSRAIDALLFAASASVALASILLVRREAGSIRSAGANPTHHLAEGRSNRMGRECI